MLGDAAGPVVANGWGQGGDQHQTFVEETLNPLGVGLKPIDTEAAEAGGRTAQ